MVDYKKYIKKRSTREKILRMISFVPDKPMISLQYWIKTGCKLNLKSPKRFTEKLQWYKLYYRDPLMKLCVDKHDVREYVKECGLTELLNEEFGVYDSPDDIDFSSLPKAFVLKDTLGGGGNSVIIVEDKETVDENELKARMKEWTDTPINTKNSGREWVYDGRKHRIQAEAYIPSLTQDGGLVDWKFFCFNGKAEYLYIIADRDLGQGAGIGIYDMNFQLLPYRRADERPLEREIAKPNNFEEMRILAERLSKPFPEARIDFYNVNNKVIFGEITFFDGSGYMKYEPDEFDLIIGSKFILPEKIGGG